MEALIEHEELRASAQRVLESNIQRNDFLAAPQGLRGIDPALWRTVAGLGWLGLTIPERLGGLQQPFAALSVLYRELGRALSPLPLPCAAIGLEMLAHEGATTTAALLVEPGICGEVIAVSTASGDGKVSAQPNATSLKLNGRVRNVLSAGDATHLLVPVDLDGPAVVLVPSETSGLDATHQPTWDITRRLFDVSFTDVEVPVDSVMLSGPAAAAACERAAAHFDLALACDALGGAETIFAETLAYMETRKQFNRAIASFQALKHRCADMKTAIESCRALIEACASSSAETTADWRMRAACARIFAGAVYKNVSEDAIQLHGGIGFTWEQSCHLFLKRARLGEVLGGSAERRKDRVAPGLFAALSKPA